MKMKNLSLMKKQAVEKRQQKLTKTNMEYKNFEDFLSDKCDTHTNNDPAGFERWMEELDREEYIKFADEYAELQSLKSYNEGYHRGMLGLTK